MASLRHKKPDTRLKIKMSNMSSSRNLTTFGGTGMNWHHHEDELTHTNWWTWTHPIQLNLTQTPKYKTPIQDTNQVEKQSREKYNVRPWQVLIKSTLRVFRFFTIKSDSTNLKLSNFRYKMQLKLKKWISSRANKKNNLGRYGNNCWTKLRQWVHRPPLISR